MLKVQSTWLGWLALSSIIYGCASEPGATRIIGPDGTAMLHVHCSSEQVACFRIAGERCPAGYDLSPIFDPHDGNFLVRCRVAQPALVSRSVVTVAHPPESKPTAPSDEWPPIEVARPAEPWPSTKHAEAAATPGKSTSNVNVGIGY